jgi:predicted flavoprotein YhiN
VLDAAEGLPIKNIHVRAGGKEVAGELLVTRYGLEGGAIYALGSELRKMAEPAIEIDFKPTFSAEELAAKPIKSWKLSDPAAAILSLSEIKDPSQLAKAAKSFRIPLLRPRPLAEAISSAGGIRWEELDENLMLRKLPGVFVCGEMIDWDAPTGGYLLQAAFATGTRAGKAAAGF